MDRDEAPARRLRIQSDLGPSDDDLAEWLENQDNAAASLRTALRYWIASYGTEDVTRALLNGPAPAAKTRRARGGAQRTRRAAPAAVETEAPEPPATVEEPSYEPEPEPEVEVEAEPEAAVEAAPEPQPAPKRARKPASSVNWDSYGGDTR